MTDHAMGRSPGETLRRAHRLTPAGLEPGMRVLDAAGFRTPEPVGAWAHTKSP